MRIIVWGQFLLSYSDDEYKDKTNTKTKQNKTKTKQNKDKTKTEQKQNKATPGSKMFPTVRVKVKQFGSPRSKIDRSIRTKRE